MVNERIRALPIPPTASVLVVWNDETAVVTDWAFFAERWDDFCYPASDDVTIWAPGEPWTLCYRHFDVMQFDAGR
jgi:hypothetical protein